MDLKRESECVGNVCSSVHARLGASDNSPIDYARVVKNSGWESVNGGHRVLYLDALQSSANKIGRILCK